MTKFNHKKSIPKYRIIAILMTVLAIMIVGKASYTMSIKRDYWMKVAARVKKDSVPVTPNRGNILSCDGQLLASSLPEYKIFMDFGQLTNAKNDSLWDVKVDSICDGLAHIFPEKTAAQFKADLTKGHKAKGRHWPIWNKRINYGTFAEVKRLPIFRLSINKGGFHYEELTARERPFGTLAKRTVGIMYAQKDNGRTPRCGLELSYDSLLRGTTGIKHRRKVLNKYLDIIDTPPIAGADILTTIDVRMQDLAERAVLDELKKINGDVGVAIVMEVKTGDIKAIVNMDKCEDGEYREIKNHAVSDLLEPGSVFKPISIMTALEDGMCDTNKVVDTGNGVYPMYGRKMKDWSWRSHGFGVINIPKTLEVSSNIGVSRVIDEYYHKHPEKFVEGVYRSGIAADLHIPIHGASSAKIRMPKRNKRGEWVNWSNTTLPWMSIGYETQVPPISTLAFYNAIANGGKMMRPRFVKQAVQNGKVIQEFPPQVVQGYEQIASPKVIALMQDMLRKVVSEGLGHKAGSNSFQVSGKTGTAQISQGAAGYKAGQMRYLLSFAGYFPSDAPRYSCIVCIQKSGLPASGGGMSGVVFHEIAEGIMAQSICLDAKDSKDSISSPIPDVKDGNILSAEFVLNTLGIRTQANYKKSGDRVKPVWGMAEKEKTKVVISSRKIIDPQYIPDVIGMGARDAVYLIESRGVKCQIIGRGKVVKQSLEPGHFIKKGDMCQLTLE